MGKTSSVRAGTARSIGAAARCGLMARVRSFFDEQRDDSAESVVEYSRVADADANATGTDALDTLARSAEQIGSQPVWSLVDSTVTGKRMSLAGRLLGIAPGTVRAGVGEAVDSLPEVSLNAV